MVVTCCYPALHDDLKTLFLSNGAWHVIVNAGVHRLTCCFCKCGISSPWGLKWVLLPQCITYHQLKTVKFLVCQLCGRKMRSSWKVANLISWSIDASFEASCSHLKSNLRHIHHDAAQAYIRIENLRGDCVFDTNQCTQRPVS